MKVARADLLRAENNTVFVDETLRFGPEAFAQMHNIRSVPSVRVSGEIHYDVVSERVYANLSITGVMIVPCSITLDDVEVAFHSDAEEVFSFGKCSEEEVHEAKGEVIELLPVIFQQILMEIPLTARKPGIKEYPQGEGWKVIREEDLQRSKEKEIDPRLAKLREFKAED